MSSSGLNRPVPLDDRGGDKIPVMARKFFDGNVSMTRTGAADPRNHALLAIRLNSLSARVPGGIVAPFNGDMNDPEKCGALKSLDDLAKGKAMEPLKEEYEHARQGLELVTAQMEANKALLEATALKEALRQKQQQELVAEGSVKTEAAAPAQEDEDAGPNPARGSRSLRSGGPPIPEEPATRSEQIAKVEELERQAKLTRLDADYKKEMHEAKSKLQAKGFNHDEWEGVVEARLMTTFAALLPKFVEFLEPGLSSQIMNLVVQDSMSDAEKLEAMVNKLQDFKSPDSVEFALTKLSGLFNLAPLGETTAVPFLQVREELDARLAHAVNVANVSVPYRLFAYISILPDGPNSGLAEIKRKTLAMDRSALYEESTLGELVRQIDQYKTETVRVTNAGKVELVRTWTRTTSGPAQRAGNSGNAGNAGKGAGSSVAAASAAGKPGAGGRPANAGNAKPGGTAQAARAGEGKAKKLLCHKCHEEGHFRANCPLKRQEDSNGTAHVPTAMDFTPPHGGAAGARNAGAFSALFLDEENSEPEVSGSEVSGTAETTGSGTDMVESERDVLAATAAAASKAEPGGHIESNSIQVNSVQLNSAELNSAEFSLNSVELNSVEFNSVQRRALRMVFDTRADVSLMAFVPEGATPTRALIRWGGMDSVASRVEATWTGTLDVQDTPTGKWTKVTGRFLCVPGLEFDFLVGRDTYSAGVRVEDGPRGTTIRQGGMCLRSGPTGVYQVRMVQGATSAAPASGGTAKDDWKVVARNSRNGKSAGSREARSVRHAPVQGRGNGSGRRY